MHSAMESFQRQTTELLDVLALFPERSRQIAPEGEWSAAYIIHHLADGELHFASRYLHTLGSDNPRLVYFEEERYPTALHYEKRSIAKSLAAIAGLRAVVVDVLTLVEDEAWERITTGDDGQEFTLAAMVEKAHEHMKAHIEQLRSLHAQL
ncbi:MAG: DinB family protein [Candidatus Planktophila sp.]